MKRFGLAVGAGLWLAVAAASPYLGAVAAKDENPMSIVRNIYLQFEEGGELIDVPEMYFTPSLLGLWQSVEADGEKSVEAALGFPVFNNEGKDETIAIDDVRFDLVAEKYVVASYVVLVEDEKSIAATKKYFQYNFQNTDDGWKIDNIDWGRDKKTLRQYLTEIKALRSLQ